MDLEHNPNMNNLIKATEEMMKEKYQKQEEKGMIKRRT